MNEMPRGRTKEMNTPPMTHQELVRTPAGVKPGKRKQRAWLAGGAAVVVAGMATTAALAFWHPGGNPGGVRQQTLRSVSVAVPRDAKVQSHSVGRPIWDSCDGRPGTQGGAMSSMPTSSPAPVPPQRLLRVPRRV